VSAAHCINGAVINIIIGVCVRIEIKITFTGATTVKHTLFVFGTGFPHVFELQ